MTIVGIYTYYKWSMDAKKNLSVAFLWHMHQPLYKDLTTGKYRLPWIRLHSTYSYLDMASILDDFSGVKVTFNFTPSLIWQILDITKGGGGDDVYLRLSEKNASHLTDDEKYFLLKNFFSCDLKKGIFPFNRYRELFSIRGDSLHEKDLRKRTKDLSTDDFRDLQVFFNLAWCGFTLRKKDPVVRDLIDKGARYTEEEKSALLKRQSEVVASILPAYKRLQDEGRAEISTSPFYHPILPLLCRGSSGKGFAFSEDARAQTRKAIDLYEEVFGKKPRGMWPSEGSVSQEIIPMLADENIKWIATDEGILLESFRGKDIQREDLIYDAYTAEEEGRKIDIIFRDINISNAISFRYADMPAEKASADLIKNIREIKRVMSSREDSDMVAIILDGENPWPYYNDGGEAFLSRTYGQLAAADDVGLVTVSGYLDSHGKRKKIGRLFSGSWINRNFDKWIGSPQKDKAWDYLKKAREDLFASEAPPDEKALEELYIAEGSDWFWWYDDFGTELNFVFDELYRLHLSNIYSLSGKKVPYYLESPIPSGPSAQDLPESASPGEMPRFPKVLFVSPEVVPFAKTGGLADVSGSLPRQLASLGCDVRVIMPLYRCVEKGAFQLTKETTGVEGPLLKGMGAFDLYSTCDKGVTTYFVKSKKYFAKNGLYGTPKGDFKDNGLRFSFFQERYLPRSGPLISGRTSYTATTGSRRLCRYTCGLFSKATIITAE